MIVQNMKGTNLYNKYAIRSVGIIKEKRLRINFHCSLIIVSEQFLE